MGRTSDFLKTETGSRAEEEKKLSRRAALALPLLALAACDDDDDDDASGGGGGPSGGGGGTPATGRNPGELGDLVVSFTVQDAMTSGVSADSFELTVGGMDVADAMATVADSDGMALAADAELAEDAVVVVTFTSGTAVSMSDTLAYSITLAGTDQGGITIDGTAADATQGTAFLGSSATGMVDTKGPEITAATPDASDAKMVTVTFSEDLTTDSVDAGDFTVMVGGMAVAVSAAMAVANSDDEVVLTLASDWAAMGTIEVAAMAIKDGNDVLNAAISFTDSTAASSSIDSVTVTAGATAVAASADEAGSAHVLFVTVAFGGDVEAGAAGDSATDAGELAAAIFELATDSAASNFAISDAAFSSDGAAVDFGTAEGQLLGAAGANRGDFDSVVLTIQSTASGSATDLYLGVAAGGLAEADGTALSASGVVDLGDLVADA